MVVAAARTQHAFRLLVRLAELRRQATTDDLTGLPNRRAMYTGMTAQLAAGADEHQALLLLDLDSFKEVNDSLGHHVGDRLLIKVGACLSEHLRDGDCSADSAVTSSRFCWLEPTRDKPRQSRSSCDGAGRAAGRGRYRDPDRRQRRDRLVSRARQ
jgi:hypothetical protein